MKPLLPILLLLATLLAIEPPAVRSQDPSPHGEKPLTEKTLVVWVAPSNLDQRGGSALTLEDARGNFDGIVFAELAPKRWMAGSEMFHRTERDQSQTKPESTDAGSWIQMAAVYSPRRISLFRNAELYAEYEIAALHPFAQDLLVHFGPRHQGKDECFAGRIDDARIYDRALSPSELAALKPNIAGPIQPWAWWTFNDADGKEATGRFPSSHATSNTKIANGQLHLDGTGGWIASTSDRWLRTLVKYQGVPTWQQPPSEELQLDIHLMHPGGDSLPGDPNPAYCLDGTYHLHYIFAHPYRGQTSFSFAHVTSPDMLHWSWQPTQLQPALTGHGMFSGTGFLAPDGRPAAIYHGQASGKNQIAIAKDRSLSAWETPYPIVAKLPDGSDAQIPYWDPDCFRIGDTYYAISGGENPPLMKSTDLRSWTLVGPFMAHDMPDVAFGEDVSCPNFFPIGNKWMLLCISHPLGCRYYLGDWDAKREQFVPTHHGRLNWRRDTQPSFGLFQRTDFFAPESLLTDDGRRVMWAWLTSIGTNPAYLNKTIQSLPRELSLHDDGSLRMHPIRELESLRYDHAITENVVLNAPVSGHTARVPPREPPLLQRIAELPDTATELRLRIAHREASRKMMGWVLYSDGRGQGFPITFKPENGSLRVGDVDVPFAVASLPDGEDIDVRIFIDKYLIEVFVNGRQAVAAAYSGDRSHRGVDAFTVGVPTTLQSVESWKLRSTQSGFHEAIESRIWVPRTE